MKILTKLLELEHGATDFGFAWNNSDTVSGVIFLSELMRTSSSFFCLLMFMQIMKNLQVS